MTRRFGCTASKPDWIANALSTGEESWVDGNNSDEIRRSVHRRQVRWPLHSVIQLMIRVTRLNLSLRAQRGNLVARASTQLRKSYDDTRQGSRVMLLTSR